MIPGPVNLNAYNTSPVPYGPAPAYAQYPAAAMYPAPQSFALTPSVTIQTPQQPYYLPAFLPPARLSSPQVLPPQQVMPLAQQILAPQVPSSQMPPYQAPVPAQRSEPTATATAETVTGQKEAPDSLGSNVSNNELLRLKQAIPPSLSEDKPGEARIALSEDDQRILATIRKFRHNNPKYEKFLTGDAVEKLAMGLEHPETSLKLALDSTFGEEIRAELHHKRWWRRRAARSGLSRIDTVLRFMPLPKTVKSNARGFIQDVLAEKKADVEKSKASKLALNRDLLA